MAERLAYSAKDLVAMFGRTESTYLSMAYRGELPSYRVGGCRFFPAEAKRILAGRVENAEVVSLEERRSA